jgi:hypothetical protein
VGASEKKKRRPIKTPIADRTQPKSGKDATN